MTPAVTLFLAMTVVLAAAVVIHAAHVVRLVSDTRFHAARAWQLVPGIASAVVWRDGARALPIAFVVAVGVYALLWALRAA